MAATLALAQLARADVPEAVAAAYGETSFRFGADYLIPKPFDPRVLLWVAPAVAQAAMETGVARIPLDLDAYRHELESRLGRRREVMRDIMLKARRDPRRIVFPEGEHPRVIRASVQIADEGVAHPVLLGRPDRVRRCAQELGVDLSSVDIVDPWADEERAERYADRLWRQRQRKGLSLPEARERIRQPLYFGCMMVAEGDADGLIAGEEATYPDTIRPALEVVGVAPDVKHVAGLYMMILQQELMFFADTTVNIDPDAETLAEIALLSAAFVKRLGIDPRIAMLSFSNFGSSRHPLSDKVRQAVEIVKRRAPDLMIDGEMQADTAVIPEVLEHSFQFSSLNQPANVLIFPDLDAANICYKLLARLGGAEAIGPILLGMAKPVHILQRGSQAADILNLAAIATVDALRAPAGPTKRQGRQLKAG